MGTKKATKKFEKNRLSGELERRKDFKKVKQRNQIKAKRKARNAKDNERVVSDEEDGGVKVPKPRTGKEGLNEALKDMTVDDFFQQNFEMGAPKKSKKSNKAIAGKRKRDEGKEEDNSDSGVSLEENAVRSDSEPASDAEDETGEHKEELDALAKKDPEFYKYLQDNDAELLDFAEDANLSEVDRLSENEEPPKKKRKGKRADEEDELLSEKEVTEAMVEKWRIALSQQHSLRAMRQVVLAFRAAAHANEEEGKEYKDTITSPEVYHKLLVVALKHIPDVLEHHLPVKESANGRVRVPTDTKKFRTLTPLLNSHAASITHLLDNLSDAATLKLTQASILPVLPYVLSFKKVIKNLLKVVINIWSDASSTEATRINAFLLIRRLAAISDESLREAVLKTAYQGLIKGSRNTTFHTIQGINLMKNSAVELWGVDPALGYITGFTYIRQLATHLRTSTAQPTKDSYKTVYNWQYIHALDFWSRVLSTHCSPSSNPSLKKPSDSPLHPLVYPLIQVTLGAITLIPTSTYIPLRVHLLRSLLRLCRSTSCYIPLAPHILDILTSSEMKSAPKPSTQKPFDFNTTLRAPKSYIGTRVYQDAIGEQVVSLLAEYFSVYAKNVAFPELIIPPVLHLKRWLKDVSQSLPHQTSQKGKSGGNRNAKINASITLLIAKLTANADVVTAARDRIDYSVSDRSGVGNFLKDVDENDMPLVAFVVVERKEREKRQRILEQGLRDEEKRRREGKATARAEEEGGEMEGVESEAEDEEEGYEDEDVEME